MSTRDDDLVPGDVDDLADLFAAERGRPAAEAPSVDFEARLWTRIATATGGGPGGGGSDDAGGGGHGPGGGGHATATGGDSIGPGPIVPTGAAGAVGAGASGAWLGTTAAKLAFTAAVFVAGGATTLVVEHAVVPAPVASIAMPPATSVDATVPAPPAIPPVVAVASAVVDPLEPSAPRATASAPLEPAAHVASASSAAPRPSSSAATTTDRDADLEAERALLERARTALGRSDANGAIDALGQHATRFPKGRLGEEREALWIQALVASGRSEEARTRFERFRARHPQSLLVQALESTLGK